MKYSIASGSRIPQVPPDRRQYSDETPCDACRAIADHVLNRLSDDVESLSMIGMLAQTPEGTIVIVTRDKIRNKSSAQILDPKETPPHKSWCNTGNLVAQGHTLRVGVAYNPDPSEIELDFMPIAGQVFVSAKAG